MDKQKAPAKETMDDHAHNADIKNQDPRKPHYLNSPLHEPKLPKGVANTEDVTNQGSVKKPKPE
jgi:hypothetical protein